MDGGRILLAFRDSGRARRLRDEIAAHLSNWQVVGVVDPSVDSDLAGWSGFADVVLIGARELLLLQERKAFDLSAFSSHVVVLADEHQLLDVAGFLKGGLGLIIQSEDDRLLPERAELAIAGHVTMSAPLLQRLSHDEARLDIIKGLPPGEREVLRCLGCGMSNREIARVTGIDTGKVKTFVHSIMRKLRMKNRTAVAVFAARKNLAKTAHSGDAVEDFQDAVCLHTGHRR